MLKKIYLFEGDSRYDIFSAWIVALEKSLRRRGVMVERGRAVRPGPGGDGPELSLGFNWSRIWSIQNRDVYHVAWLVDHPVYSAEFFFPQLGRIPINFDRCVMTVVDRGRLDFAQRIYRQPHVYFLPHPCIVPLTPPDDWMERSPIMLMFGSIVNPATVKSRLQQEAQHLWPVLEPFVQDLPESAVHRLDKLVWSAVYAVTQNAAQAIVMMNAFFPQIDIYQRNTLRLKMLRSIRGREVHLYGVGNWNELGLPPNVRVHPSVTYAQALSLMRKHRWVLNHAPTLSQGTHERVLDAVASGCAVLSTPSTYLEEEFLSQGSICFATSDSLSLDAEIAAYEKRADWKERALFAQAVICDRHRMEHRLDALIRILADRWPAVFS